MKQLLAVSILVFIFVGIAYAPDVQKISVYVDVSTGGAFNNEHVKPLRIRIESYIKRELRALQDVDITNKENGKYIIAILVAKRAGASDIAIGSMLLRKFLPISRDMLREESLWVFDDIIPKENFRTYTYLRFEVTLCPVSKIEEYCKQLIAEFDVNHFEVERKAGKTVRELKDVVDKR